MVSERKWSNLNLRRANIEREQRQRKSAVAAGQPEAPPNPQEVAARFKQERIQDVDLQRRIQDYDRLKPKEQFETLKDATAAGIIKPNDPGYIEEGSKYAGSIDIDFSKSGLSPKEIKASKVRASLLTGRPTSGWGFYNPEQVKQIEKLRTQRRRQKIENKAVQTLKKEQFEQLNTRLPDNKWIDSRQLNNMRQTQPEIYALLINKGFDAANNEVNRINAKAKEQQAAIATIDKKYRVAIPPTVPEGADAVTGAPAVHGHDVVAYVRDNPDKTALLITAGYDAAVIADIKEATKSTAPYWTPDGRLDVYAAYVGGVNPEHIETLTGVEEKEVKGVAPSYREFLRSYAMSNPKPEIAPSKKVGASGQWEKDTVKWTESANDKYEELYGKGSSSLAQTRLMAAGLFAPARALEPRVELKDIRTIEWVIGGVQVALYTAPFWIPQVAKVLKPLSKLDKSARAAGRARLDVDISRNQMLQHGWDDPAYAKFASNLQHDIQASMKADKLFLNQLASLERISSQQLVTAEKLSRIKGLSGAVNTVNTTRLAVVKAWDVIDKSKYYIKPTTTSQLVANENYLTRLGVLKTAQNNLADALAKASGKLTPVYQLSPGAGWSTVINNTQREIKQLRTELGRAETSMNEAIIPSSKSDAHQYWLEINNQLTSAQNRLTNFRAASSAGKTPPDISKYMVINQTATQSKIDSINKMLEQVDDWLKGKGAYEPVVAPESTPGAGRVAVAVRPTDKIAIPKTTPKTKLLPVSKDVPAKASVKAPVVEPSKTSVFPGITKPQVKIITPKKEIKITTENIAAMTPAQAQRRYGNKIKIVDAVSPFRISSVSVSEASWLSPQQAIDQAKKLNLAQYTRQITDSATKLQQQMRVQGATQAQMKNAVDQAIKNQVKTIENTALQTQVQQALKTRSAIKQTTATTTVTTSPTDTLIPPVTVLPILLSGSQIKQQQLTKKERKAAVSWPQGFGWWVVFRRNGRLHRHFHKGQKPPTGIKNVFSGPGEAARGIQKQKGEAPISFNFGLGIVKVGITDPTRLPGKAGAIKFTGTDSKISSGRPRITPSRPPIR